MEAPYARFCERCVACERYICFIGFGPGEARRYLAQRDKFGLLCPACAEGPTEAERLVRRLERKTKSRRNLLDYIKYATPALKGQRSLWVQLEPAPRHPIGTGEYCHSKRSHKIGAWSADDWDSATHQHYWELIYRAFRRNHEPGGQNPKV